MKNEIKMLLLAVYASLVTLFLFMLLPSDSSIRTPHARFVVEPISKSAKHPKIKRVLREHCNAKSVFTNSPKTLRDHIKSGKVLYPVDNPKATEIPNAFPAALNPNTSMQSERGYPVQVVPKDAQ